MRSWVIVLAAGEGSRLTAATGGTPKQFLLWKGAPLYWQSALTFSRCARIAGLVFVFPGHSLAQECARLRELDATSPLGIPWLAVPGGTLRQDSVRHGLEALRDRVDADRVLIHDTARPFVSPALVNRVLDSLAEGACAAIPGIPVTDTIKVVQNGLVTTTPERALLRAVQTPQGFNTTTLMTAHQRALAESWIVTDDAALLERCGLPVRIVEGEPENLKITHPGDLDMLRPQAGDRLPCVGFGYDVHRYAGEDTPKARPMRLGGVPIPTAPAVLAHSDGDVLLHALADALLGCCGEGDIGLLFPDTDPACDNLNSAVIVDEALERLRRHGLELVHADLTVIAQLPKVAPHRDAIRRNIARLLQLAPACVNIKATTEEGLGFTGAKQGIKAVAVITAVRCRTDKDMSY